jgi:hypothetical protein
VLGGWIGFGSTCSIQAKHYQEQRLSKLLKSNQLESVIDWNHFTLYLLRDYDNKTPLFECGFVPIGVGLVATETVIFH